MEANIETKIFEQRRDCIDFSKYEPSPVREVACGWVSSYRDQGGVLFVDMRDRTGLLQIVFDRQKDAQLFELANTLRAEYAIGVEGAIRNRDKENINTNLPTGKVEMLVGKLHIFNTSKTSPIPIGEYEQQASEDLRLKYRYIDLRRKEMQVIMQKKNDLLKGIRDFFHSKKFWEIETPILNKSTPEGARDFLVPVSISRGNFYALPQSPQIFKQILMIAQTERYYQIARCFRDEDLRSDRQLEFTQVDVEMSFCNMDMVMKISHAMVVRAFQEGFGIAIPDSPKFMKYAEAMEKYGTDRPDIRFPYLLVNLDEWAKGTNFQVFQSAIKKGGVVRALCFPNANAFSRKRIEELTNWVMHDFKAKGLAWVKHTENGLESVITKFIPQELQEELIEKTNSKVGDIIFFAADSFDIANATLSSLRIRLAEEENLIPPNTWEAIWITDFPAFKIDKETKNITSMHNPFSTVKPEDMAILESFSNKKASELTEEDRKTLLSLTSCSYDIVVNGVELGGGSLRIHNASLQKTVFQLLGLNESQISEQFGFFLNALEMGAPPHGGIAFGLDRLIMLGLNLDSIRDAIPFPKTQKGQCLMSQSPSTVAISQLQELGLSVKKN